ncbi:DsbA family oxidoreductase [Jeongeupia chitinilytica]|uniref:2-hydroxychromene-2-carboxylate isomerase n=1 Tax=Jeongeupia chitinilytica TaxID=1041641 RepID=A0ABQ3H0Y2_9NEIS|nr:DsbA family oxidoreductase [Jeongeupia chitinilytica]GHD62326.1 2-hydroxychromene-2-carboxylate isomerase [Jeongeupia chitinilytica]
MSTTLKIDFVSDISCPWCAIGLQSLLRAAESVRDEVTLDLQFHPYELNPQLGPEGHDVATYLMEKYGMDATQLAQNQAAIRDRGAEVGIRFNMAGRRAYNTFDAHRLLAWAGEQGPALQLALKQALFVGYFTEGDNLSDHDTLVRIAGAAGLDGDAARELLAGDRYADTVRNEEAFYQQQGITAVPAVIVNEQYLISGGQPVEVFANALQQIARGEAG